MSNYDHRMKGSKPVAYFAESWYNKKGAMERVRYIVAPIMKYHRTARSILEVGCGMGDVLVNLPKRYSVSGLDYQEDFIKVAQKRMPKSKFYVHSMHNFRIDEKFDVIFSAFDAVNFLEDFSQWKSTFKAVSEHLYDNGLFIFDVYTPKMLTVTRRWLEKHRRTSLSGREFSMGYYFDRGLVKGNVLTWDSRVFEKLPSGLYQLNRYRFIERIYPVARMKSALSERFDILEANLREEGRVILFVCKKR
ncbi:MAG: class I SAM-dependent methyltransferase [Nitrososphaerales archaeon]